MAVIFADIDAPVADEIQLLGIAEFARRMKVCPNTVRNWIDTGRLKSGVNYYRAGRVIRFPWDRESVLLLMRDLSPAPPPPRPRLKSKRQNRASIKLRC